MRRTDKRTYTKKAVKWLLVLGCINGTLPFVLSAFGRDPVSDMGIAWVTEIVAVALGYFVRGFKDTKESEKVRLLESGIDYSEELKG